MLKTLLLTAFTLSLALGCANKGDSSVLCPWGSDKAQCAKIKADCGPDCKKPCCEKKKTACKTGCTKPCCAKVKTDTP